MRWPVVLLAPWRRAPLLLLRRLPVLLAVVGATAVLGVAAAATPLFLSSTGSAALTRQVQTVCPADSMPFVRAGSFGSTGGGQVMPPDTMPRLESAVSRATARVPGVRPAEETATASDLVDIGRPGVDAFAERLVFRTGFRDHIPVVASAPAVQGVWITDDAARFLGGARPGDRITVTGGGGGDQQLTLPIAGVYRNLEYQPHARFWCAERNLIYPPGYGAIYTPPMLLLADHAVYQRLTHTLGLSTIATWQLPPSSPDLSITEARRTTAALPALAKGLAQVPPVQPFFGPPLSLQDNLPRLVTRSVQTAAAVRGAIAPAAGAGAAVALLLVAAAGSYWADRRRPEVRLLAARGVSAPALGTKAALEMGPAAVFGGAMGWALAYAIVRWVGPSAVLETGALRQAVWTAGAGVAAGVLLMAGVATLRVRTVGDAPRRARGRRVARYLPWELAALAIAAVALWRVIAGTDIHRDASGIAHVDPLVLAFPLVFLVAVLAMLARATYLGLRLLRRRGGRTTAGYLVSRRLAGAPQVALIMLAAAALPIGSFVYSTAVTRSVQSTLHAKVDTFTGSDVAAVMLKPVTLPPSLRTHATPVLRSEQQQLGTGSAATEVDVIGVDPATFARGAFWTSSLGHGRSLQSLLAALRPTAGQPVPAIVVGAPPASTLQLSDAGTVRAVPLRVVDTLPVFPGRRSRPAVVVAASALTAHTHDIGQEVWFRSDPTAIAAQLQQAGISPLYVVDRDQVLDASSFLALTWTFGFLSVIAALTGAIAVGGLLLYLETRTRTRLAAYVLARRMGLRRPVHFRSLLAELGALLGAGLVTGAGLAWLAADVVHGRLDVAPELPPGPLLPVPVTALVAVAAVVGGIVVLAACGAQWSADRARPADVMRFDG